MLCAPIDKQNNESYASTERQANVKYEEREEKRKKNQNLANHFWIVSRNVKQIYNALFSLHFSAIKLADLTSFKLNWHFASILSCFLSSHCSFVLNRSNFSHFIYLAELVLNKNDLIR